MPRCLKEETLPARHPRARRPLPAHLCCCERASWLPRLPAPVRAGENPPMALGSGTESCREQLPEHDTSTRRQPCTTPQTSRTRSAGVQARAGWVRLGARI